MCIKAVLGILGFVNDTPEHETLSEYAKKLREEVKPKQQTLADLPSLQKSCPFGKWAEKHPDQLRNIKLYEDQNDR